MSLDFPKPGGFASLTTASPKQDSVPLGKVLRALSDRLSFEGSSSIDDTLELFLDEHIRYADATRIASLSSPHALKKWAAERLPSLRLSYGFTNRVDNEGIQANLDEKAPLRLIEFADDLTLIAQYCRTIQNLKIEAAPHSHGVEFRFTFQGRLSSAGRESIEESSIQALLHEGSKDNCLRKRIFVTENAIEAQCIALRKKVRLGFSPNF